MEKKRSAEEGQQIVEDYERSGLTRRQFCERSNIPLTTLDYWRGRKAEKARLVEVAVERETPAENEGRSAGFNVVLTNGRRIESSWSFREADLISLIRVVESA